MATLGGISTIGYCISNYSLKVLRVLHSFIFGNDGDPRRVRKNLRSFQGFDFEKNSEEYINKVEEVKSRAETVDLVAVCHVLHLDYSGTKDEVAERIVSFLIDLKNDDMNEEQKDEEEEDEGSDGTEMTEEEDDSEQESSEDDDENYRRIDKTKMITKKKKTPEVKKEQDYQRIYKRKHYTASHKDVEGLVRNFSGADNFSVEKWINEFEDVARLLHLDPLQKLVFAQRMLTGAAKMFVQGEYFSSWSKLKKGLLDEFKSTFTNREIHQELSQRSKKSTESFQEYFLSMKEIASRGSIDDESLIEYIIDGIQDYESNKVILFGATSLNDLKTKIKVYEKMKKSFSKNSKNGKETIKKKEKSNDEEEKRQEKIRCFNCGELSTHTSANCPSRSKGTKCFKCNEWGHKAQQCTRNKTVGYLGQKNKRDKNTKKITIDGKNFEALIDTGSDPNLIKLGSYQSLQNHTMRNTNETFSGANDTSVIPIGFITADVRIDDEEFTTKFYVVPEKTMRCDVIIGDDLLKQAIATFTPEGFSIEKYKPPILFINRDEFTEPTSNFGEDSTQESKNEATDLVDSYKPCKTKSTNVDMTIPLKDTTPVSQPPRSISLGETAIVDDEVEQWLKDGIVGPCSSECVSQVVVVKKDENRRTLNRRRRQAIKYEKGDLVAINTSYPTSKLRLKFSGPYRVTRKKGNAYDVVTEGDHDGPKSTTTWAQYMKEWPHSGRMWRQSGRVVGKNMELGESSGIG